jgi:hypothetical protein
MCFLSGSTASKSLTGTFRKASLAFKAAFASHSIPGLARVFLGLQAHNRVHAQHATLRNHRYRGGMSLQKGSLGEAITVHGGSERKLGSHGAGRYAAFALALVFILPCAH